MDCAGRIYHPRLHSFTSQIDHVDVSVTSLTTDDLLVFNGSVWVNTSPSTLLDPIYIRRDGTNTLTGDWDVGGFNITGVNDLEIDNDLFVSGFSDFSDDATFQSDVFVDGDIRLRVAGKHLFLQPLNIISPGTDDNACVGGNANGGGLCNPDGTTRSLWDNDKFLMYGDFRLNDLNTAGIVKNQSNGLLYTAPVISGAEVELSELGTATYDDVQNMNDIHWSSGFVEGGDITDNLDGTVDIAAGKGKIRATAFDNVTLFNFDWAASAGITIPVDSTRYIGVEYNAGSPQVVTKTTDTWDFYTDFPLWVVTRNGATALSITDHRHKVQDIPNHINQWEHNVFHIQRDEEEGGLILGETGTRNITVTEGSLWLKFTSHPITAIDTSVADTFDRYYRDGIGGWTIQTAQTQWDNQNYDDGDGTLGSLSPNRYSAQYFWLLTDGKLVSLYGQNSYLTLAGVEADTVPATLPDRIAQHGFLIGRIIFQYNDTTAQAVETVFVTVFTSAGVTNHNDLAGIFGASPFYHSDQPIATTDDVTFNSLISTTSISAASGNITGDFTVDTDTFFVNSATDRITMQADDTTSASALLTLTKDTDGIQPDILRLQRRTPDTNMHMALGVHYTSEYGYIQAREDGIANRELWLNPLGGDVVLAQGAAADVTMFEGAASGETRNLKISGFRAADSLRTLDIGVGTEYADTASFSGIGTYYFDSALIAGGDFAGAGLGLKISLDGSNHVVIQAGVNSPIKLQSDSGHYGYGGSNTIIYTHEFFGQTYFDSGLIVDGANTINGNTGFGINSTVTFNRTSTDSVIFKGGIEIDGRVLAGVTRQIVFQGDFGGGANEWEAGGVLESLGNNWLVLVGSADTLTAGAGVQIGYAHTSPSSLDLSALEIANVTSGFGNMILMKSGGNVGIGRSPTSEFDVYGTSGAITMTIEATDTANYSGHKIVADGGNMWIISRGTTHAGTLFGQAQADASQIYSVDQDLQIGTYSANKKVVFGTNNTLAGAISATSDWGFGTVTPDAKAEIETTTTYGKQALTIDQNDADQAFIDYQGTESGDLNNNISTFTTEGGTVKYVKLEINGSAFWFRSCTAPTA